MFQGTGNTVIAPAAVFLGHTHHQALEFCINRGTTWCLALMSSIALLGDQFPVPGQNRVGGNNTGNLRKRLLAQPLTNLGERLALRVSQSYTAGDLLA